MTAKEYFIEHLSGEPLHQDVVIEAMIKFAKYHVEQALTEASKTTIWKEEPKMQGCKISFVKSKILNAYPLENIK